MIPLILVGALTLTGSPAASGPGWSLGSSTAHLDRTGWSVQFYDTYSRTQLRSKMLLTAAELERNTGVDFYVGTTINRTGAACPGYTSTGRHRIVVRLAADVSRSYTWSCKAPSGLVASSSVVLSKDRWLKQKRSGSSEAYRRNVSSHELGHSVGLGHPALCSLPSTDPLQCGDYWGGYGGAAAHKYTPYDVKGLRQLVVNRP